MKPNSTSTRVRTAILIAVLGAAALGTSCSAEERFIAAAIHQQRQNDLAKATPGSLTDAQLARLAKCESSNNPAAVSRSGRYMGLYQFDQRTWNGVAKSIAPEWVNVRPSDAPAAVQDAMARSLYSARGRQPWPHCGRNI